MEPQAWHCSEAIALWSGSCCVHIFISCGHQTGFSGFFGKSRLAGCRWMFVLVDDNAEYRTQQFHSFQLIFRDLHHKLPSWDFKSSLYVRMMILIFHKQNRAETRDVVFLESKTYQYPPQPLRLFPFSHRPSIAVWICQYGQMVAGMIDGSGGESLYNRVVIVCVLITKAQWRGSSFVPLRFSSNSLPDPRMWFDNENTAKSQGDLFSLHARRVELEESSFHSIGNRHMLETC